MTPRRMVIHRTITQRHALLFPTVAYDVSASFASHMLFFLGVHRANIHLTFMPDL